MKKTMQIIWQDDLSRQGFGVSLFFLLTTISLLGLFWFRLPPQVPLFYSHPWGEEQLANPFFLLLLPGSILAIFATNLVVSQFSEEKLFLRSLILASGLYAFLSFFALARILFLIF